MPSGLSAIEAIFFRFSNPSVRDLLLKTDGGDGMGRRGQGQLCFDSFRQPAWATASFCSARSGAKDSLYEVKDRDPVPDRTEYAVAVWGEENVPLTVDGPDQVRELHTSTPTPQQHRQTISTRMAQCRGSNILLLTWKFDFMLGGRVIVEGTAERRRV